MGCVPSTPLSKAPTGAANSSSAADNSCLTGSQKSASLDEHRTPSAQQTQALPEQHQNGRPPMARDRRISRSNNKMQGKAFKSTCESPTTQQLEHDTHIAGLVSEATFFQHMKSSSASVLSAGFDACPLAFNSNAFSRTSEHSGSRNPNRNSTTPQLSSLSRTRPFVDALEAN